MNWNPKNNQPDEFQKAVEEFFRGITSNTSKLVNLIAVFVVIITVWSAIYTVQPEEQAVVTQFGKYIRTDPPGLHFKVPFGIQNVTKVKTSRVLQESFGFIAEGSGYDERFYARSRDLAEESLMLTGDLNVADVRWVVQYQIADPKNYLFKVKDPVKNIRDISQAVMRRTVGDRTVNDVLTVGREQIANEAKVLAQKILDDYEMGVKLVLVKLQDVNPPQPVQPSFNEVNAAKQEQEQAINRAESSYNKVIPEARGRAEQEISKAEGTAMAVLNTAKGDALKFTQILKEYEKAPQATKTRLYLESIEEIFGRLQGITIVDPDIKGMLPIFTDSGVKRGEVMARPSPNMAPNIDAEISAPGKQTNRSGGER